MIPLHEDPWFTFRFADDRRIPRFHLEGVPAGAKVTVVAIDPVTDERREVLMTAVVGADGWVDLEAPLLVRAGEAFIVTPEP